MTYTASSLNSAFVFVFDLKDKVFIWSGHGCLRAEKIMALRVAQIMCHKSKNIIEVEEGHETKDFWANIKLTSKQSSSFELTDWTTKRQEFKGISFRPRLWRLFRSVHDNPAVSQELILQFLINFFDSHICFTGRRNNRTFSII